MNTVNQKIIDAVIAKAEKVCPNSLALIGVYGSVATGDTHEKSDLDLLILIQNDEGWQLGTAFILEDNQVGYDIYCTNWDGLKYDAQCHHAQISKLMESKIVYIKNQDAYNELCKLREQAKDFLASEERFERVRELVEKAKVAFADAHLQDELGRVRLAAYGVIYYSLDALMLFHGKYFKRGVKRTFEELVQLPISPEIPEIIKKIAASKDVAELRDLSRDLLTRVESHVQQETSKEEPSPSLWGTYEEMYSNWRNKVEEAEDRNDVFASYVNLCNLHLMFSEIATGVNIGTYDIMGEYNPDCLEDNVALFDKYLDKYAQVYKQAGIELRSFADVDAFVVDYLEG